MDSLGAVIGGMIGPLLAVVATWFAVRRAFRRDPAGVQRVMLGAFFAKFVFFGVYVVLMIKVFKFEAVPQNSTEGAKDLPNLRLFIPSVAETYKGNSFALPSMPTSS